MCLIAIAPKGVEKMSGFFEESINNGFNSNKDGAGFAYKIANSDSIYYHKGFMSQGGLMTTLRNLKLSVDDELIVHLRSKTKGLADRKNCHPFILHDQKSQINDRGPSTVLAPVMFHSGHLTEFADYKDYENSDSYIFAEEMMSKKDIYTILKHNKPLFMELFGDLIGSNKFAFLFPKTNASLVTIGSFISDNGYFFSNENYKPAISNNCKVIHPPKKLYEIDTSFSMNTTDKDKIKITSYNAKDLILSANCSNHSIGYFLGEKFTIVNYQPNSSKSIMLQHLSDTNKIINISNMELLNNFTPIAKLICKEKFQDYFKLKHKITPSKSIIGKLFKLYQKHVTGYTQDPDNTKVTVRYDKHEIKDIRLDSINMFIIENSDYIPLSMTV